MAAEAGKCIYHSIRMWSTQAYPGVSNRWTGIRNGTMEWKMEWSNERTRLQLTRVTGTAQSRSNYLVYF